MPTDNQSFQERIRRRLPHENHTQPLAKRHAAVAVIVRRLAHGTDDEILFIHRAENPRDPWSGQIGLPGGHVEPTDSNTLAAVQREVCEEVAIDLTTDGTLLGVAYDITTTAGGRTAPVVVTPFVFALKNRVAMQTNSEVQRAFWLSTTLLSSPENASSFEFFDGDTRTRQPCIRAAGQVIWGLTLQIITATVL